MAAGEWTKLIQSFLALQVHNHATSTPTTDCAEIMLPETFTETPAEIFTMLGELNGLVIEKGDKCVGQFVESAIKQASVRYSVSMFTTIKTAAITIVSLLLTALLLYCVVINTPALIHCAAMCTRIQNKIRRQPPQYEETAAERPLPKVLTIFYQSGSENVEFRDIDLRSANSWDVSTPRKYPCRKTEPPVFLNDGHDV